MRRAVLLASATALALELLSAPSAAAGIQDPSWQRGANVTTWWHDEYASSRSDAALARLAATGTKRAAFVTTWYMSSLTSSTVAPSATKTPSDASLLHAMAKARALGMEVVLKPHVDLYDGSFRADLAPADPSRWFSDYRGMLNHYADLAQQGGASMLVVGTELSTMALYEGEWRRIIAEVRGRFSGTLTFASMPGWAAKHGVRFWDALDYIGIDAYVPLADPSNPNPTVDELVGAWRSAYVPELHALHREWGKPVLFTELGYQSRLGTAATPWGGATGAIDQVPQQRAYEAAYRALAGIPWFHGIYWWDWRASNSTADDGNHPLAGKLAESTVLDWNHGLNAVPPLPWVEPARSPVDAVTVGPAVVSLRVGRLGPRGRASIAGTVRQGAEVCRGRVKVRLLRLNRARHRWAYVGRRVVRSDAAGRFLVRMGPLRSGRYRTRAVVLSGSCASARSTPVRFRVRA